jgi:hypothetical protein
MEKIDRNSVFLYRDPHIPDRLYIRFLYTSFFWIFKIFKFSLKIHRCFTENRKFGAKTDRNFVFLGRGLHISNWLYIMVLHMSFYKFWKNSYFCSKFIGAYGFTENRQFEAKTDRNSVFLCRDPHIPDSLYITVPYMSFYRF